MALNIIELLDFSIEPNGGIMQLFDILNPVKV